MSNDLIKRSLWRNIFTTSSPQLNENNYKNIKLLLECKDLQYHSQKVTKGDAFIAIEGSVVDGHRYIVNITDKAKVILANVQHPMASLLMEKWSHKVILVPDTKKILSPLAASFYSFSSKQMTIIGITGTNGKTSVCEILKNLLTSLNFCCGVIGTNGIYIHDKFSPNENTTPIAIELQKNLSQMKQQKVDFVLMEVSSHALTEGRADHVDFDGIAFTNLTSEHLDFHGNLENYFQAKKKLFLLLEKSSKKNTFAICCTDSLSKAQKEEIKAIKIETIFFQKGQRNFNQNYFYQISSAKQVSNYQLTDGENKYFYATNLLGEHNGENLTTALLLIKYLIKTKKILAKKDILKSKIISQSLQKINIKGRLEKVAKNIFIDYAHTPDAVEKILKSANSFTEGRVITLFGCGGDRDKEKRSQMGEIACKLSHYCFITSDNPRTEEPKEIIKDIVKNIQNQKNYSVIIERRLAIEKAIDFLREEDNLFILGKGHENYQIIGREKIPFDEKELLEEILSKKKN